MTNNDNETEIISIPPSIGDIDAMETALYKMSQAERRYQLQTEYLRIITNNLGNENDDI